MPLVASKITRVALTGDQVISNGTIRVHNIIVSNALQQMPVEVVFTDREGTPILNITVSAQDSQDFPGCWAADKGLTVLGAAIADADVVVTVIHSQDGA
jgi:hypothetical protein